MGKFLIKEVSNSFWLLSLYLVVFVNLVLFLVDLVLLGFEYYYYSWSLGVFIFNLGCRLVGFCFF